MKTKGFALAVLCLLCSFGVNAEKIRGNGNVVSKEISIENFDAVEAGRGIAHENSVFSTSQKERPVFNYSQKSGKASLVITTDENILSLLDISTSAGKLSIRAKGDDKLFPTQFTVRASSEKLEKTALSGTIGFILETPLKGDQLKVSISGAGNIIMEKNVQLSSFDASMSGASNIKANDIHCERFQASVSGAGNMTVAGKANTAKFSVSGAGIVSAYDFTAKDVSASISGTGNIKVNATGTLDASVSGVGNISYKGDPSVKSKKSGMGSIRKK